ncbi:MAG: 2-oxoacid:acceptor oxidoreductase family protein [Defluviitaleaceae bacterium]|nr:2-oxoacid:acceptor oxidoreductase family protein [Defluviitaleaceae bacterium]
MATTKIIFSGFGGQGVLTLGQIVANIAMNQGKQVTWMPSYGAEMRGGTANCGVIISDKPIGSPIVASDIDILVAMNEASILKFEDSVKEDGQIYVNSSLILEPISHKGKVDIDATNIANRMGNAKVANMVMLSGFLKRTELFTLEDIEQILNEKFKTRRPELIPLNIEAIKEGMKEIA